MWVALQCLQGRLHYHLLLCRHGDVDVLLLLPVVTDQILKLNGHLLEMHSVLQHVLEVGLLVEVLRIE